MQRQLAGTKEQYKDIMRGMGQILLDAAEHEEELMRLREMVGTQQQPQGFAQAKDKPQMPF